MTEQEMTVCVKIWMKIAYKGCPKINARFKFAAICTVVLATQKKKTI